MTTAAPPDLGGLRWRQRALILPIVLVSGVMLAALVGLAPPGLHDFLVPAGPRNLLGTPPAEDGTGGWTLVAPGAAGAPGDAADENWQVETPSTAAGRPALGLSTGLSTAASVGAQAGHNPAASGVAAARTVAVEPATLYRLRVRYRSAAGPGAAGGELCLRAIPRGPYGSAVATRRERPGTAALCTPLAAQVAAGTAGRPAAAFLDIATLPDTALLEVLLELRGPAAGVWLDDVALTRGLAAGAAGTGWLLALARGAAWLALGSALLLVLKCVSAGATLLMGTGAQSRARCHDAHAVTDTAQWLAACTRLVWPGSGNGAHGCDGARALKEKNWEQVSRSCCSLAAVLCGALALRAATVRALDGAAPLAPLEYVLAASMVAGSLLASTAPVLSWWVPRRARSAGRHGIGFLIRTCVRAMAPVRAVAPWTRMGLAPRGCAGAPAGTDAAASWWAVVTTLTHVWNARWGDVGLAALVTLGGAGSALLFVTQVRMPAVDQDFAYYFRIASNLATSLVTAGPSVLLREESLQERPPLYPLLLTGLFTAFGASPDVGRIGQALLHGLVPLLTYAGVRCFAGPGWAILGALLAAWHPHVFTAVSVLSYEHLQALTWLAATVWLWYTFQRQQLWHYAVAALLWAISALVKPYTLAGPLLLLGGVAVVTTLRTNGGRLLRRRGRLPSLRERRSNRGPLLFVAVFLLALVPWLVRSRLVYGEVVPVTPGIGLGVWAATLDPLPTNWSTDSRIRAVQARALQTGRSANAAQVDRVFLEEALARIAADPWQALRTLTGRQLRAWLGVPHDTYAFYEAGSDDPPATWRVGLVWPQVQAAWAEAGLLPRVSILPLMEWARTQTRHQHRVLLALAVAGLVSALVRRDRAAALAQLTPWCIFLTVWPTLAQNRYAVPFYPLFVLSAVYALACGPLLLPLRPSAEGGTGAPGCDGAHTLKETDAAAGCDPLPPAAPHPDAGTQSSVLSPQSSFLRRGAQAALLWLGTVLVLRSLAQTVALAFLQRGLPGP